MSGSRASIWKLRKEDIILVVKEMGLTVAADMRFIDLYNLIENSDIYKNQLEVFQRIIDSVTEKRQRQAKENEAKLEIERRKLAGLEKLLEIERKKKHFRKNKNCVTRSYPNLEIELQGTNGNCSYPLSIPEEEKCSSPQPADLYREKSVLTRADDLLGMVYPVFPAINKNLHLPRPLLDKLCKEPKGRLMGKALLLSAVTSLIRFLI
ncbi:hypothetical protein AVEN_123777-1 [Araneus ventricosus]|uniref:Uncharacterized protein n=1 Tax=Araneus ventricosus TaxID=182803 RepID=A0A4Y2BK61_ARAVE|nr:hypothetical protein AVEN_123777-1 [Araneus ventricosus]